MTSQDISAVASLVSAIAWPLVVAGALVAGRKRFGRLLDRVKELDFKGPGVEASMKLRETVHDEVEGLVETDPDAGKRVTPQQVEAADRVAEVARRTKPSAARDEMARLAAEYERLRGSMAPGDLRTRRMELMVTTMRTLAVACEAFLPEFTQSDKPGERLAAIAILQVRTDRRWWDWLAARQRDERPFVGYQAAVAMLTAARTASKPDWPALTTAIRVAQGHLADKTGTDRYKTLDAALAELVRQDS